jgi:hypothetical protein
MGFWCPVFARASDGVGTGTGNGIRGGRKVVQVKSVDIIVADMI